MYMCEMTTSKMVILPNNSTTTATTMPKTKHNGGQSVNHFSSNLIAVAMIMCIIGFQAAT